MKRLKLDDDIVEKVLKGPAAAPVRSPRRSSVEERNRFMHGDTAGVDAVGVFLCPKCALTFSARKHAWNVICTKCGHSYDPRPKGERDRTADARFGQKQAARIVKPVSSRQQYLSGMEKGVSVKKGKLIRRLK